MKAMYVPHFIDVRYDVSGGSDGDGVLFYIVQGDIKLSSSVYGAGGTIGDSRNLLSRPYNFRNRSSQTNNNDEITCCS